MTLYRVWIGADSAVWTAHDEQTARREVEFWAWMATGEFRKATKVEVVQ